MPEEIKNETTPKKDINVDEVINNIFNKQPEKEDGDAPAVKPPVNIFSRPIPVTQDDAAKRARLKIIIIEGLLFGAFLTAITAIYAFSGLELKLDPENGANLPSVWFFLLEFVVFSIAIGVGDYFLTEKRVNDYNSKIAGVNFDIDDEIEKALKAQEEDGITAEVAAAQNKSNGEEEVEKPFIDIKLAEDKSLTDKKFEAYLGTALVGSIETCKAVIANDMGMETIVIYIKSLAATTGEYRNGAIMELINAVKASAADNGFAAVVISKRVYGNVELNIAGGEKYGVTAPEEIKIQEAYPGALMGVSGTLKV